MESQCDLLIAKFYNRSANIVVIGLGYVGLPMAVLYARAGFIVTGIEDNPERVLHVNRGESYIEGVEDTVLAQMIKEGRLDATTEYSRIASADVVIICVPTPLDEHDDPDTGHIEDVLDQAESHWHAGQLVVLESTTYPGTTEELFLPRLSAVGLEVGEAIFLVFSPERIDPGNTNFALDEINRVIGGVTNACTNVAQHFYQQVLEAPVIAVSSPKVAEMSKLFENVFRAVNVALVNELAQLCDVMGLDVWDVIDAAKSKPYGFMPFYPGPGAGGHCIPIDPVYLSWKARQYGFTTKFIELAVEINDGMPQHVVGQIGSALKSHGKSLAGSNVLVLGVAFKRDVADMRESASLKVAELLVQQGALVRFHDPHVPTVKINGNTYNSVPLTPEELRSSDLVLIATDHSTVDYGLIASKSSLVYDTRNALREYPASHIHRLGAS